MVDLCAQLIHCMLKVLTMQHFMMETLMQPEGQSTGMQGIIQNSHKLWTDFEPVAVPRLPFISRYPVSPPAS